jgi:hypothetical protein
VDGQRRKNDALQRLRLGSRAHAAEELIPELETLSTHASMIHGLAEGDVLQTERFEARYRKPVDRAFAQLLVLYGYDRRRVDREVVGFWKDFYSKASNLGDFLEEWERSDWASGTSAGKSIAKPILAAAARRIQRKVAMARSGDPASCLHGPRALRKLLVRLVRHRVVDLYRRVDGRKPPDRPPPDPTEIPEHLHRAVDTLATELLAVERDDLLAAAKATLDPKTLETLDRVGDFRDEVAPYAESVRAKDPKGNSQSSVYRKVSTARSDLAHAVIQALVGKDETNWTAEDLKTYLEEIHLNNSHTADAIEKRYGKLKGGAASKNDG